MIHADLVGWFLAAGLLSFALTWGWSLIARKLGFVDLPNPIVPQHIHAVAHSGGIALAATVVPLLLIQRHDVHLHAAPSGHEYFGLLAGGVAYLALGWLDDLFRLSARLKLVGQLVLAVGYVGWEMGSQQLELNLFDAVVAILFVVTLVNAVNLTDVCDGLVGGLAVIAVGCLAWIEPSLAPLLAIIMGAVLGFLVHNIPPARVFLGDAGSHWLGFTLAALILMQLPAAATARYAMQSILIPGILLLELALLIIARARKGIPFWQGSPDHFSLRLQAAGISRWSTILLAWSAGLVSGSAAVLLDWTTSVGGMLIFTGVLALGALAIFTLLRIGESRPSRPSAVPPDDPPRLLWIHQNFVAGKQAGNHRAVFFAAALIEKGWQVDIVTTQNTYLEDSAPAVGPSIVVEREGRLAIHRLKLRGGPNRRVLSWLEFCARSLLYFGRFRRVDVVFASTPHLPQVMIALAASVFRCAPVVLEVRDLWPAFLRRLGLIRLGPLLWMLEWMEASAYRAARACVAVSPGFLDYLVRMGIRPDELLVSPTGAADDPAVSNHRVDFQADHPVIIYAGSLNEAYDIDRIVETAEITHHQHPNLQWWVVGNGRGRGCLESAAARLPNLKYFGVLPHDEVIEMVKRADLGLVSLVDDALLSLVIPGKLLEYFSARLPVVCTNRGLAGAIVEACDAGRVVQGSDAQSLADTILGLLRMTQEDRSKMGLRGQVWSRRWMPGSTSARNMVSHVERVYSRFHGRSQWIHTLWAVLGGGKDVLTRRSSRAQRAVIDADVVKAARASLEAWLTSETNHAVHSRPLPIPNLLRADRQPVTSFIRISGDQPFDAKVAIATEGSP